MRKYFVLSAGRTGSSLLSACLAEAGANFGLPPSDDWDRNAGAMENDKIHDVVGPYLRALEWSRHAPPWGQGRIQWKLWRNQSKWRANRLLKNVDYFKLPGVADTLAEIAARLGYQPVPIINTRPFQETVDGTISNNNVPFRYLTDTYCRTYENALIWLRKFGGCIVDYNDLMDPNSTQWAFNIQEITGLDVEKILDARRTRLKPPRSQKPFPLSTPEADAVYKAIMHASREDRPSQL